MPRSTPAAVAAIATLAALGGTALAWSPSQAAPSDHRPPEQRTVAAKAASGLVKCDGGASRALYTRLSADPFSFSGTSGNDLAVPGAQVSLRGPSKGTDTVLVTFSAETYYSGSGWMGLEVHKDGAPIAPYDNNGSPFAFTSQAAYSSNSAQFCTKIRRGVHTIAVQTSTTGDATESGWIDDWTMSVQRFD